MTREEFNALYALPEHKIIEVSVNVLAKPVIVKCSFPLTMQQELNDLDEVVNEFYAGNDYVVLRAEDFPGTIKQGFITGRVTRILDNYSGERIKAWVVQKIDMISHNELEAQETRITRLHERFDMLWNQNDISAKADVLFEEYLALEQAEAEALDQEVTS